MTYIYISVFFFNISFFFFLEEWLTKAFRTQRPTMSNDSPSFPNFFKYENLLYSLENSILQQQPWIEARVAKNTIFLSSSSSSSSSSSFSSSPTITTFKQLHGEPWTATLVVPNRTSASALPTSSYCPPPIITTRTTTEDQSSKEKNIYLRKKSKRVHHQKNKKKEKAQEKSSSSSSSSVVTFSPMNYPGTRVCLFAFFNFFLHDSSKSDYSYFRPGQSPRITELSCTRYCSVA